MIAFLAPPWSHLPADGLASGNDYLIQDAAAAMSAQTPVVILCQATTPVPTQPPTLYRYVPRLDGTRFDDPEFLDGYAHHAVDAARRLGVKVMIVLQPSTLVLAIKRHAPELDCALLASSHHLYRDDNYYDYGALSAADAAQVLAESDVVVALSHFLARRIGARHPGVESKFAVIRQGVNPPFFAVQRTHAPGPRVLYVGRIEAAKGTHVLIEAFGRLSARYANATLTIAGDFYGPGPDDYRDEVRDLIARQPDPSRIRLAGWVSRSALPAAYADADIFVHPAIWDESFASSVLEAMACGLPVVATRTGGTPEAIRDRVSGLLVPPDNVDALADALEAIAGSPELAARLSVAARAQARDEYTWDRFAASLRQRLDTRKSPMTR